MTNYEKMKEMTVEEMAKYLEQVWFGTANEVKEWLNRESI